MKVSLYNHRKKKQEKLQEMRERGLISPSSDWTIDSDGEPVRKSKMYDEQGNKIPKEERDGYDGSASTSKLSYKKIWVVDW